MSATAVLEVEKYVPVRKQGKPLKRKKCIEEHNKLTIVSECVEEQA